MQKMLLVTLLLLLSFSNTGIYVEIKEPRNGSIFHSRNISVVVAVHACCNDAIERIEWIWEWENGRRNESIDANGMTSYEFSFNISLHYGWNRVEVIGRAYSGMQSRDNITIYYDGPIADANGPYKGKQNEEIAFEGDAYGGYPPYNYTWEFGDGSTGYGKNVSHHYSRQGLYRVKFTVRDSKGYEDVNITYAIIEDGIPPYISIKKPDDGIYIFDRKISSFPFPLIVGTITIEAVAMDNESGIKNVTFYVDDVEIKNVKNPPYECQWNGRGLHEIIAIVYDFSSNSRKDSIKVIAL